MSHSYSSSNFASAAADNDAVALLSTEEAAKRLRVSRSRVLAMIRVGTLKAVKVGRDWVIDEAALTAPKIANRKPGRPRKK